MGALPREIQGQEPLPRLLGGRVQSITGSKTLEKQNAGGRQAAHSLTGLS